MLPPPHPPDNAPSPSSSSCVRVLLLVGGWWCLLVGKSTLLCRSDVCVHRMGVVCGHAMPQSRVHRADTSKEADRPPVFDEYLGLAVEAPRDGLTTEKLWAAV